MTQAVDEAGGLFGPDTVSWRIDRELIVLAGGSCALLMQAAHPVVAAGVAEHSTYATDPFGRLMRTLTSSFDVVFGSRSRAEATIRRVNAIHNAVRGTRPDDGSPYSAHDPEALLWVHATLVDTALRVYGRFVAPLSAAEEQAYHDEAARVAVMLGVRAGDLPATVPALRSWMDGMVAQGRVRVTPAAREIAQRVLFPVAGIPRVVWEAAHLVSFATLPAELRRQYGIRWSPARERGMAPIATFARRALPLLPAVVRFAPQAHHAERRVARAAAANR